jgi:predicted AAA+ superfamily ATPase
MLKCSHMVEREFWRQRVEKAWEHRTVVWLSGVRRVGKTFLSNSLDEVVYYDCELPSTRRILEDPVTFLDDHRGKRVVLDEIHRVSNPSELLKIASDHYPSVKVLATGSSSLGASARFRDTLTDRKADVWLSPMIALDMEYFGNTSIKHRLLRGGLPPFFLEEAYPDKRYQEWLDNYWAKDILELFRLERRYSFLRFAELLFVQSGGIFEATKFAVPCEVSRTTISNYLNVLEMTYLFHVLRPFNTRKATEIVAAPKVYGFDTGFVCYFKGWSELRESDLGLLWEHFVLNELLARLQTKRLLYWRDKSKHEVDFVLPSRSDGPTVVECKWSAASFIPANLICFRSSYPSGKSYVVGRDVTRPYGRAFRGVKVDFVDLNGLVQELTAAEDRA